MKWLTANPEMTSADLARLNGLQALAHMQGARAAGDGTTWVLEPMTPQRMLLLLIIGETIPDVAKCFMKPSAPYFFNLMLLLPPLNAAILACRDGTFASSHGGELAAFLEPLIANDGHSPVVKRVDMFAQHSSYVCAFPRGYVHGKSKNITRRLSLTLGVSTAPDAPPDRYAKRYREIAIAKHGEPDEREAAIKRIRMDTKQLSTGGTHKFPAQVLDLMVLPHTPFHALVPTPEQSALIES